MEPDKSNKLLLSDEAKRVYLTYLIGKMIKILHLIEEEKTTGYSPYSFMVGRLFEMNAANELFNGELVSVIVKLSGVAKKYKELPFQEIKKQIFEIKRILKSLITKYGGEQDG